MNRPKSPKAEELAFPEYWNSRYAAEPSSTFDWFKDPSSLSPFLHRHLPSKESRILHLGCGNSQLPASLHEEGYKNQYSIDFSTVVIADMQSRHPDMRWEVMDVRKMAFEDEMFDVAIDKGTLDAMLSGSLWDPSEEVRKCTGEYINEVARVLRKGGVFLYITFRQPHFIRPIVTREEIWPGFEIESLQAEKGMFEYFGFVMKKK